MMKWNSIFLSKKATLILVIIVEKESFMSTIPIQKTLSKEELKSAQNLTNTIFNIRKTSTQNIDKLYKAGSAKNAVDIFPVK